MSHLTPVGRNHIGRGRQPRSATEFRHHFTAREALLSPARVLRVGQHAFQLLADRNRFIERPAPFGSSVTRACGKRFASAVTASASSSPASTPPFSLKSLKPYFRMPLPPAHHRIRGHCLVVAKPVPVALFIRLALIRQWRQLAVADKEQIAQHFHFATLLPSPSSDATLTPRCWPSRSSIAASMPVTTWIVVRRSKVCRPRPRHRDRQRCYARC